MNMNECVWICNLDMKIKKNCLLGHSDIAPNRKLDPGEKFNWNIIKKIFK